MKKGLFILALLSMSSSYAASKTSLFMTITENGKTTMVKGFNDSSFEYSDSSDLAKKTICYKGPVAGVCKIIEKVADRMNEEYSDGAHDAMESLECTVEGSVVKANYTLIDDYSDSLEVKRTIAPCK